MSIAPFPLAEKHFSRGGRAPQTGEGIHMKGRFDLLSIVVGLLILVALFSG
jgi:hypothetical protein